MVLNLYIISTKFRTKKN